jgi:hypothetical protein
MHPKLQTKIPEPSTSKLSEQKIVRPQHETLLPFSTGANRKVRMDVQCEQPAVIEFLLFEGCLDDEIRQRFHNVYSEEACYRTSVFRWIQEVCSGNEELRDEGRPSTPCRSDVDASMRSILQDEPNPWFRTIGVTLSTSSETVRTHLARIGSTVQASRWVPHTLMVASPCASNCFASYGHTRTRKGMVLSPGTKVGSTMDISAIGYGRQDMKIHL